MMRALIHRSDFYLLPNVLTLGRVIAIPLVAWFMVRDMNIAAAVVFALAGISDYADGWIARRYGTESKLGVLLDPLADKLIIVSTMIMLLWLDRIPTTAWLFGDFSRFVPPILVIATVAREIAITGIRTMASSNGIALPVDRWGKLKTWIQFFAILLLLLQYEPTLMPGFYLLCVSVATAVYSGLRYTVQFVKKLPV